MRGRLLVFLAAVGLFGGFTGLNAAQVFPAHPVAALVACVAFVYALVGAQFAQRFGLLGDSSRGARALAWASSVGMAVWATFFILSIITSLAGMALSLAPGGALVARSLPAFAAGASVVIAALGLTQAIAGPRVRRVTVPVRGLPPALRGLTIAQISDLHVGPTIRRHDVARAVARVLALKPDLIAITGDLVDGPVERLAVHVEPLSDLTAPLGVYFVTGNHEYYAGASAWLAKVRELGVTALVNENRVAERDGARVLVGGIPDESGGSFVGGHSPDVRRAFQGGETADFRLLLAHRPTGAPEAAKAGFDLQLSGHTHGGQFFPASLFIGLFHRHSGGLGRSGSMWIYVSRGTGYWGPVHRFGVPAEIALLTLASA